jgi:mannose-6-phosphate isomerase-like protein (cupin superfamily)
MQSLKGKKPSFWIVVAAVAAVAASVAIATTSLNAQSGRAASDKPLVLPGHTYGLPGTLITAAEQQKHLDRMKAIGRDDIPMNMVKQGGAGKHQVGISIVYREEGGARPSYAIHDDVAEMYYILEGSGRIDVGGTLTDAQRRPFSAGNGEGQSGTKATGSKTFALHKGDFFLIPAGSPHRWMGADAFTAYAVVRIDPEGVAPLLTMGSADYEAQFKRE